MNWPLSGGGTFVNLKNKTGRVVQIGEIVRKVRNGARPLHRWTDRTVVCVSLQTLKPDQSGPFALEGQCSVRVDFNQP